MAHRTPVAIIVFNRPEIVARLLDRLSQLKPSTLFVIADGPRRDRPSEAALVGEVRKQVAGVSWRCEVVCDYAEENMGCRRRVVSGLNWVFGQVDQAIILEDDCLPTPSFIEYAEVLLERFCTDSRVGSVCGSLSIPEIPKIDGDYFFSRYNLFTGWATWRRAWALYDDDMQPVVDGTLEEVLAATFSQRRARWYWRYVLRRTHAGRINSWGYRWLLSCWANSMMAAFPRVTLVENVGFGQDATNTRRQAWYFQQSVGKLTLPIIHPRHFCRNDRIDQLVEDARYSKSLLGRIRWLNESLVSRVGRR